MKTLMILLLFLGIMLIGYGILGLSTVYDTWSDSYPLFDALGDQNPLKDHGFRERFNRHFLSAKGYWYPVPLVGFAVFLLAAMAINVEAKQRRKREEDAQL